VCWIWEETESSPFSLSGSVFFSQPQSLHLEAGELKVKYHCTYPMGNFYFKRYLLFGLVDLGRARKIPL
jgi:hypothetical protein